MAQPPFTRRKALGAVARTAGVLGAAGLTTPLAPLVTACAQPAGAGDAAPARPVRLSGTVQHVYWGGAVEAALQYAMDGFVKRNPAAKVDLVPIPNAQVQEKLILLVAAGTAPDAAQINPRQLTPLIDKGILMDVTRYARRDAKEFQQEDFFPSALERLLKNGKLYGAPVQMGNFVLLYNQDALQGAGEKLPDDGWTWETLADVAKRVVRGEAETRRFGTTPPGWEILVWAYGGEILDKAEKVCLLTDPRAQAGLQWLQDIRHKHQAAPRPGEITGGLTNQQLFLAGRLVFHTGIPGFVNDIEKGNAPFKWDLAYVPKGPARRATIVQGPSGAAIAQSTQPDLAWDWLNWWTGPEVRQYAARADAAVGARRSGAAEYLKQPGPPHNRKALIDSANFARNQPYIPQYDEMTKIIDAEWTEALVNNTKSVKDATESAKRQIDALLATR